MTQALKSGESDNLVNKLKNKGNQEGKFKNLKKFLQNDGFIVPSFNCRKKIVSFRILIRFKLGSMEPRS